MQELRDRIQEILRQVIQPLALALANVGIFPNHITITGFALSCISAFCILGGYTLIAGVVWLAAGFLDLLDGTLARVSGTASRFGAFLDSNFDRLSEGVVLSAIVFHFAKTGQAELAGATGLALLASLMVSYTRARGEALGAHCQIGLATRAERVGLVGIGLCFAVLGPVILILLTFSLWTVGQRLLHIKRVLSEID